MKRLWCLALVAALATVAVAAGPPVEFTFLGIDQAKNISKYQVKILTDKPVTQVDVDLKFYDAAGKVLFESMNLWRNVVKSASEPIEQGKTYTDADFLPQGAVRAEAKMVRVWFKDGTTWEAPK
jgi:hypothetical protein